MNVIQDLITVGSALENVKPDNIGKVITIKPKVRSISSFASNAIYYFPVLVSNNVAPDTAGMISRNLEMAYASFVRSAIALMPAMKTKDNVVNVEEYLSQFHQNMGIDSGSLTIRESVNVDSPWDVFANPILNEATFDIGKHSINVNEHNIDDDKNKDNPGNVKVSFNNDKGLMRRNSLSTGSFNETEYKKASEFIPTYVKVTAEFLVQTAGTGQVQSVKVDIPVGIKTQLHVLSSMDVVDKISDSVANKGTMHNLIRWSTGEMLSLKDILFGITKMKHEIAAKDETSEWFSALKRRKRLADMSLPVLNKKAFLPNASVVISISDVEIIKQQYGVDLLDSKFGIKLLNDNFLLSLVITDDMSETAYILYDGYMKYEEYPYSTLCRENAQHDKEMKTLIQAIGKMR